MFFKTKHVYCIFSRLSTRSNYKSHRHSKASLNRFCTPSQADDDLETGRDHFIRSDLIQQLMCKTTFKLFFIAEGNMIKHLKVPGANKYKPYAKGISFC